MWGARRTPGQIIYGGIDAQGRRLYEPFVTGANVGLGLQLEEQRRTAIRDVFHGSLLMMVGAPNRTATEVLAQQEEKLRLMGPHLGRLQMEFLDPLIQRVFSALRRAGALAPAPEIMAGRALLKVNYVSPLARAQRMAEGSAVTRTLESIGPLLTLDPEIMNMVDGPAAARALAQAHGLPARVLRDDEAIAARKAEQAQAALAQGLMQAAPQLAGALNAVAPPLATDAASPL